MSEISWNAWEISPRFHNYGFVLLNRLRIVANTIFSNPKPVYYLKRFCSAPFFTYLDSSDRTQTMIQLKQGYECLLHYDLSRRVIWRNAKTVMIFGFLAPGAFQRYILNYFATLIYSRYYTFTHKKPLPITLVISTVVQSTGTNIIGQD